jgi:hypothetical protein
MNQLAAPPFLEYTIRFQNTGNFPATFVRVTNPVSNLLDMSTFEILATSHVASTNFLAHSRNMEFFFDNINLSDSTTNEQASHGFIRYRIKPIANLSPGDSIRNLAYIYFDYNYPVATNTALTTIYYPVGIAENNESKNQLLIYPNPFENTITVNVQKQNVQHASFTVSNCLGQTLLSETQSNSDRSFTKTIDVGFLPEGMYFLTTTIDGRKTVNKIIRK